MEIIFPFVLEDQNPPFPQRGLLHLLHQGSPDIAQQHWYKPLPLE